MTFIHILIYSVIITLTEFWSKTCKYLGKSDIDKTHNTIYSSIKFVPMDQVVGNKIDVYARRTYTVSDKAQCRCIIRLRRSRIFRDTYIVVVTITLPIIMSSVHAADRSGNFVVWRVSGVCGRVLRTVLRTRNKKKKIRILFYPHTYLHAYRACRHTGLIVAGRPIVFQKINLRITITEERGPVVGGCCDAMEECQWFT